MNLIQILGNCFEIIVGNATLVVFLLLKISREVCKGKSAPPFARLCTVKSSTGPKGGGGLGLVEWNRLKCL